jgi:nucleoside-diphosphate-sugar epimerase
MALTSSPERVGALREQGITPLVGNLDRPVELQRLAALGTRVLHLAPPPQDAQAHLRRDPRTRALLQALALRAGPQALVYGSTSGVYGDCGGAWVQETRAVAAHTARAQRRVDAEQQVRFYGRHAGVTAHILRIPGIYALDREGGTPRERLMRGTPVLQAADDVYTNHVHADDLARAAVLALWRGPKLQTLNVNDDSDLRMADYMDLAASLWQLPKPPRISRLQAEKELPPMTLSFMSESRRMRNQRLKQSLRFKLRYPTVREGLLGQPVF